MAMLHASQSPTVDSSIETVLLHISISQTRKLSNREVHLDITVQRLEFSRVSATFSHLFCPLCCCPAGLWSFDLTVTQLQENIPEVEQGAEDGMLCSLNYLMGLIHVIVMLAPWPQQLGMLVFMPTGHAMQFLYTKYKIKNAHTQQRKDAST